MRKKTKPKRKVVSLLAWKMPKLKENPRTVIITVKCHENNICLRLLYKTNRFHFAMRLFSYNHKRRQNVVRTSVTNSSPFCFCFYHIFTSSLIHTDSKGARQNGFIYLLINTAEPRLANTFFIQTPQIVTAESRYGIKNNSLLSVGICNGRSFF